MAGDDAPPTPKKADLTDTRTLIVGLQKKRFTVHAFVLTQSSAFFRSACKQLWNNDGTIPLTDAEPAVVEAYLQWLFTGALYVLPPDAAKLSFSKDLVAGAEYAVSEAFATLIELYELGTFLMDIRFCNTIIDELLKYQATNGAICAKGLLKNICEDLTPDSTLFKLVLMQHMGLETCEFASNVDTNQYPDAFRNALVKEIHSRLVSGAKIRHPCKEARCTYHEHSDEVPKCTGLKPW